MIKTHIKMNKPVYLGFSVLDLSKIHYLVLKQTVL